MRSTFIKAAVTTVLAMPLLGVFPLLASASTYSTDFENFTVGNINGQQGWSMTGPYDVAVSDNSSLPFAPSAFGTKSFRISNAKTSGSFGDWAFAPLLSDAAGEPGASAGSFNEGTLQPHFEMEFDIAAASTTEQTGLQMSVSPDRGDGSRMSYLRFEDSANGINVYFDDVTDPGPLGTAANFNETEVASGLDRTTPHHIKLTIDFKPGPSNDVVNVYVDGNLVHTGTTWEDYYRYDPEQSSDQNTRIVKTVIFQARASVGTAPNTAGQGFLIDNFSEMTGPTPVQATPSVTTNSATGEAMTSATLNGTNGPVAADNTSFWWGTTAAGPFTASSNPSSEFPSGWSHDSGLGAAATGAHFSNTITGLASSTKYYFVAWVEVGGTWYPDTTLSFITPGAAGSCPAGTQQAESPLETVVVNSNSSTPAVSSSSLVSGQPYVLVSSGTWQNGNINAADTAFSSLDNWATYMEGYDVSPTLLGPGEFQLQVNNNFVNWGPYDGTNHTYSYLYMETGAPLSLGVFDGNSNTNTANPSWYGDNSGSLSVAVYPCTTPAPAETGKLRVIKIAVGGNGTFDFTGTNGIAPFSITTTHFVNSQVLDLAPGTYSITEAPQSGWTQIANSCHNVKVKANHTRTCTVVNVMKPGNHGDEQGEDGHGDGGFFGGLFHSFSTHD